MAETPNRVLPTALATTTSTLYTAGAAATWSIIRKIVVCNEDTSTRQFTLGIGTTNTDAAGKRICKDLVINPGQTWESGPYMLKGHASTPDLIYGLADVASKVTVYLAIVDGP